MYNNSEIIKIEIIIKKFLYKIDKKKIKKNKRTNRYEVKQGEREKVEMFGLEYYLSGRVGRI